MSTSAWINKEYSIYRATNYVAYMELQCLVLHFDVMPISTDKISCFHKTNTRSYMQKYKATVKYSSFRYYLTCPNNGVE